MEIQSSEYPVSKKSERSDGFVKRKGVGVDDVAADWSLWGRKEREFELTSVNVRVIRLKLQGIRSV